MSQRPPSAAVVLFGLSPARHAASASNLPSAVGATSGAAVHLGGRGDGKLAIVHNGATAGPLTPHAPPSSGGSDKKYAGTVPAATAGDMSSARCDAPLGMAPGGNGASSKVDSPKPPPTRSPCSAASRSPRPASAARRLAFSGRGVPATSSPSGTAHAASPAQAATSGDTTAPKHQERQCSQCISLPLNRSAHDAVAGTAQENTRSLTAVRPAPTIKSSAPAQKGGLPTALATAELKLPELQLERRTVDRTDPA